MKSNNRTQLALPCLILTAAFSLVSMPAYAEVPWDSNFDATAENGGVAINTSLGGRESSPGTTSNDHTPSDDIPALTNDSAVSSDAQGYQQWAECTGKMVARENSDGGFDMEACAYLRPANTPNAPSNQPPTTREVLLAAATLIHADGAGLRKRPEGVSYTNKYIPTLVNATHPTQTHTITLLGRTITITLNAEEYTWNWGDNTPNTTTTSPGAPWQKGMDPNTDPTLIRHYYTPPQGWRSSLDGPYPTASRTITLTTTWSGTATNPFTGQTQTINGLITTTETTDPFPLDHLIINNTDTWEEKQGH